LMGGLRVLVALRTLNWRVSEEGIIVMEEIDGHIFCFWKQFDIHDTKLRLKASWISPYEGDLFIFVEKSILKRPHYRGLRIEILLSGNISKYD
jgi:hypothetical protein